MEQTNDCTTCLWELICDWHPEECHYIPDPNEKGESK